MEQGAFWQDTGGSDGGRAEALSDKQAPVRLVSADRSQVAWRAVDLDGLIADDHPARLLWQAVERLDLRKFYEPIKARENVAGRPPTDPRVLLVLWLYATSQGVGSAREIERLTKQHIGYRWLRGEVPLNHHQLSDFRWKQAEAIDKLLTQLLGVLMHQGLITLVRVAQDGLRVRASAGASSFRRRKKLKECMAMVSAQIEALKSERPQDSAERSVRQRAAQQRAARERQQRLERALGELDKIEAQRKEAEKAGGWRPKGEPRASWTDAEARRMHMADGGCRPGYNVQLASETQSNFIVGVALTNDGTDYAHAVPMIEQIEERTAQRPKEYLFDGGFVSKQTVGEVTALEVELFAPPPNRGKQDPYEVRAKDSPAIAALRQRMDGEQAKEIYKERASNIERVNADVRTRRTLGKILVRGAPKVLCVAVMNALTYDLLRWIKLGTGA